MEIICPEPGLWSEIYRRLWIAAKNIGGDIPPPPKALILAGWWGSSVFEKKERWNETIAWAERWGFNDLIGDLPDELMHKVDPVIFLLPLLSLNSYPNRNYTAKIRPTPEDESSALGILRSQWPTIAGSLGDHTRPLHFTGMKRRRLVVLADRNVKPPWGEWDVIEKSSSKLFTKFRSAVNAAISPHEIDHIDFVH